MDSKIHLREKHIQAFGEANTLSSGSCLVKGEAELTTHLCGTRAQPLMTMMCAMEEGGRWHVGRLWTSPV